MVYAYLIRDLKFKHLSTNVLKNKNIKRNLTYNKNIVLMYLVIRVNIFYKI